MAPDRSISNSVNMSKGAVAEEVIIKISKKDLEKTMELSKKYKELEKTAERHFRRIKQYENDENVYKSNSLQLENELMNYRLIIEQ